MFESISKSSENYRSQLQSEMQRALSDGRNTESDEPAGFGGTAYVFGEMPAKLKADEYLASATGWVYACVAAIADAVANVEFDLYQVKPNGDIEEVETHPILDLLSRINSMTTSFDHMWQTQQYLELCGEAPWYIDRGPDGTGDPQNILLLRPDLLTIAPSDDPSKGPIKHYTYKMGSKNETIKPEELILLKYPDPRDRFRGKGTLEAAASSVDIDNFSEDFNRRFFYNSARPDSILSTDQKLTVSQKQQLRADTNKLYRGKEKAHKTAILDSGLKWTPMSVSQKDMDFLEQQKFSRDKILAIFRVHKSILAITEDVNLANAEAGERSFLKWTIIPKLKRITSQLNEFLLPMFAGTENMFLCYDDIVPENVDQKLKVYDSALSKGWMTINEVRSEENLESIGDLGDKVYLPNSMVPIESAGVLPAGLVGAGLKKQGIIERSVGGYKHAIQRMKRMNEIQAKKKKAMKKIDNLEKGINKLASIIVKTHKKKSLEKAKTKDMAEYGNMFIKASDSFLKRYQGLMKENFGRQKDQVLSKFPTKSRKKKVNEEDYLLDVEDETRIMVELIDPLQKEIITKQGKTALKKTGSKVTFDLATKRVQEYIKENGLNLGTTTTQTTNELIKSQLAAGVAAGEGIDKLAKRIDNLFDVMAKQRSETIARSEVIRASNFAANEAYVQSGVVEKQEWLVTEDDRTCPYCAPLDGKTIGVKDAFFNDGDTVNGSDGTKYDVAYGDVEYPPLHPSCRCTIIPVIE